LNLRCEDLVFFTFEFALRALWRSRFAPPPRPLHPPYAWSAVPRSRSPALTPPQFRRGGGRKRVPIFKCCLPSIREPRLRGPGPVARLLRQRLTRSEQVSAHGPGAPIVRQSTLTHACTYTRASSPARLLGLRGPRPDLHLRAHLQLCSAPRRRPRHARVAAPGASRLTSERSLG
jgi:hypothetical protein